jgi:hypothetical protein
VSAGSFGNRAAADLSGKSIEAYIEELAMRAARESTEGSTNLSSGGEKPADVWIAEWRAWVQGHPARAVRAGDSRDSIYEGRGE